MGGPDPADAQHKERPCAIPTVDPRMRPGQDESGEDEEQGNRILELPARRRHMQVDGVVHQDHPGGYGAKPGERVEPAPVLRYPLARHRGMLSAVVTDRPLHVGPGLSRPVRPATMPGVTHALRSSPRAGGQTARRCQRATVTAMLCPVEPSLV